MNEPKPKRTPQHALTPTSPPHPPTQMDTDLFIPGLDDADYGEQTTSSNKFLEMDLVTPVTNPINGDIFYTEAVKKFHEIPGIETTPDFMEKGPKGPWQFFFSKEADIDAFIDKFPNCVMTLEGGPPQNRPQAQVRQARHRSQRSHGLGFTSTSLGT
eukprot:scaffold11423_cov123-Isochrysis_galbana.AAC.3